MSARASAEDPSVSSSGVSPSGASSSGSAAAALPAAAAASDARDDRMPRGIPFIVANEFAERFCYYGINAILTVYMTQFLRLGDADATKWHSLFKSGAYFFPVVGAIVADVFWGKFRTIITFSLVYATGCTVVALVPGQMGLLVGLFLVAFGTGGIKPCVSANVGDQFTSKNQHLIDRAFSYFYLSINAGSSISIYLCPVLLKTHGPSLAFGVPAAMMFVATLAFWLGRKRFAVVPPAGKAWLRDVFSPEGLKTIGSVAIIYLFVAFFWALWDQSNGQTWTLQAESSLMNKALFGKDITLGFTLFGWDIHIPTTLLPAQIQVVNGLLILGMVPIFTFGIYPLMGKLFRVTPLRKMGIGFFVIASSFLVVAWIEGRIQAGHTVSVWWQIFAYVILTASEILVSITALEFSYTQAPLRMKSFIAAVFLLSVSFGNLITAAVNSAMVRPLHAESAEPGAQTWVRLSDTHDLVIGQKIDFAGTTGLSVAKPDGKTQPLAGTFLVAATDEAGNRVELMDVVDRKPVASTGQFDAAKTQVSTYRLVGPQYFEFFAGLMASVAVLFVFVAMFYRGKTHLRDEQQPQTA
jgi:POT family proton-dependent oligopeptide transporter